MGSFNLRLFTKKYPWIETKEEENRWIEYPSSHSKFSLLLFYSFLSKDILIEKYSKEENKKKIYKLNILAASLLDLKCFLLSYLYFLIDILTNKYSKDKKKRRIAKLNILAVSLSLPSLPTSSGSELQNSQII